MLGAFFVYGLCACSGVLVEQRISLDGFLKRLLLILAAGTGQLMLSIQLLSLGKTLTGMGLLAANLILTTTVCLLFRGQLSSITVSSWRNVAGKFLAELRAALKDPISVLLILAALVLFTLGCVAGWIMIPLNDCYHYEMPRFWIQHRTLLPFAVHNPRILSLSFQSEALQLPAYLYSRFEHIPEVFTFLGGLLSLAVVFSLARRLGASVAASLCAAAISVGYTSFAVESIKASAEVFLTGTFFGASLLFLMDAYGRSETSLTRTDLGCSIFCFVMACGAKNTTTLLAPFYAIFIIWLLRRLLFDSQSSVRTSNPRSEDFQSSTKSFHGAAVRKQKGSLAIKLSLTLLVCGFAGVLCSGMAWNYMANKLWFGNSRGPKGISGTVSQDFHPRAIWTRVCRGAVLTVFDTVWIPNSARSTYVSLCEHTIRALGAQQQLREDDQYDCFNDKAITPRKGLGILGIVIFLPALILACLRNIRLRGGAVAGIPPSQGNIIILLVMSFGSFLMGHLVLRWQSIGLMRLMFPFVIAGAPLTAVILEKRWLRGVALALLLMSGGMFSVFWLGQVSRRLDLAERPAMKWIARLQNDHAELASYQWRGQAPCPFTRNENYTYREVYDKLLAGIHQPCAIGFIGYTNSECIFLFGKGFQNRIIPLVDSRADRQILEPPPDLDYVVADSKFDEVNGWAAGHGFEEIFNSTNATGTMVMGFERKKTSLNLGTGNREP